MLYTVSIWLLTQTKSYMEVNIAPMIQAWAKLY